MVIIDSRADERVLSAVGGYAAMAPAPFADPRLSGHADMRMTLIDGVLVVCPHDYEFVKSAVGSLVHVVCGSADPADSYPFDIAYNAFWVGDYLFCLAAHTDPEVLSAAGALCKKVIDVRQGYAKCSCIPVGARGVITSDAGIACAAKSAGLDVLLTVNDGVRLDGYDSGFIGGASIWMGNSLLFTGDLSDHRDFEDICRFCSERGTEVRYIEGMPLYDYGSPVALF